MNKSKNPLISFNISDIFIKMSSCLYDDNKVQDYMFTLFRDYLEKENNKNKIKKIIIDELKILNDHIINNYEKEPLVNVNTDTKYNHHYCLTWVLSKWFLDIRLKSTPYWYQSLIKHSNKYFENNNLSNILYFDLINIMIKYLNV